MRERERLFGEVRTMTSQQRFSGTVMTFWPIFLLMLLLINWDQTKFCSRSGQGCAAGSGMGSADAWLFHDSAHSRRGDLAVPILTSIAVFGSLVLFGLWYPAEKNQMEDRVRALSSQRRALTQRR